MAVYWKDWIFAAPPKTGSTWVDEVLRDSGGRCVISKHELSTDAGRRITIVRSPRTWLPSTYRWLVAKNWTAFPGPACVLHECQSPTFAGYVQRIVDRPGILYSVVAPYLREAELIWHTETLSTDVCRWLGRPITQPDANRTTGGPDCSWSPELWYALVAAEPELVRLTHDTTSDRCSFHTDYDDFRRRRDGV